jgi:hypothetical protein
LGQWGFTCNLKKVLEDIWRTGQFRAVPTYTMGNYGLNWRTSTWVYCGTETCVGGIPWGEVLSTYTFLLVVTIVEIVWFSYLVWRSVRIR